MTVKEIRRRIRRLKAENPTVYPVWSIARKPDKLTLQDWFEYGISIGIDYERRKQEGNRKP